MLDREQFKTAYCQTLRLPTSVLDLKYRQPGQNSSTISGLANNHDEMAEEVPQVVVN